jgi:hypothetical protein
MIQAQHRDIVPLQRFFQTLGGTFLCPPAYLLIQIGVSDYREVADDRAGNLVYDAGWTLLCVLVVVILTAWWQPRSHRTFPPILNPSYCTIAVGAFGIFSTSLMSVILRECAIAPPLFMTAVLLLIFLVLINQALWFFNPPTPFHALKRPRS